MNSHLLQGLSLFLMILTLTPTYVIPSLDAIHSEPNNQERKEDPFTTCGQLFQCGNIPHIGYPFWDESRPNYCGHPSFPLTNCQTYDTPTIIIQSISYRILAINNTAHSIRLVRDDYWNDRCPQYLLNATLDSAHFTYANGTTDLMLYYNCQTSASSSMAEPNNFTCFTNESSRLVFYAWNSLGLSGGLMCDTSVSILVLEDTQSNSTAFFDARKVIMAGFELVWDANNTDCDNCEQAGGQCGYTRSFGPGSFICYGAESTTENLVHAGSVLALVSATIVVMLIIARCLQIYRRSDLSYENIEAFIRNHGSLAPKRYSYWDVKKMTNSFKDKLGQGGYGAVYKGQLSEGRLVAVKVLNETKANGEDFFNEVASISRTSHVNVVTLLGFCFEKKRRALIYEFMVRGSLDKSIANGGSITEKLEWGTLYQIAVGVARGLEYLHRGCNTKIVHFDIKPHNILLDENFRPKISDFGLAKLCQSKQSNISLLGARGTVGYIAPEVFSRTFGSVSHKSDVYSYGMLLLEMTGAGKKREEVVQTSEVYFPNWIYEHLQNDKDLGLWGVTSKGDEETAKKMVSVGLWCIQTNPTDRPSMSEVVDTLEGNLESLQIPPKAIMCSAPTPDLSLLNFSVSLTSISNVPEILEVKVQSSQIAPMPL